jgi:tripartite-type tricarboxylate transporter receptor subunit TctC
LQHDAIVIGRALLCGLALAGAPGLAQAQSTQNWPQHTVRLITPLGPGSGMDVAARLFAERLSQKWGQPVVVENRQGADGILAVQSFLSDRDNHSLIFGFAGLHSINPILHGDKLPYDVRDVVPVASAIDSTLALTVSEAAKVNTLAEFVALAKAQPGKLNWRPPPAALRGGGCKGRQHRHHADPIATSARRSRISPPGGCNFSPPASRYCCRRCRPAAANS